MHHHGDEYIHAATQTHTVSTAITYCCELDSGDAESLRELWLIG